MKCWNVLIAASAVLLAGCTGQASAVVNNSSQESSAPSSSAESLDVLMHSSEIDTLSEQIADSSDETTIGKLYAERGNLYYAAASGHDQYFELWNAAYMDYLMADHLGMAVENLSDKLVHCYDAMADYYIDNENDPSYFKAYEYLERANVLSLDSARFEKFLAAYKRGIKKQYGGRSVQQTYDDVDGNPYNYTIVQYDENGYKQSMSTYDLNDQLIDTFEDYKLDENGLEMNDAVFNSETLVFESYVVYERDAYGISNKQI